MSVTLRSTTTRRLLLSALALLLVAAGLLYWYQSGEPVRADSENPSPASVDQDTAPEETRAAYSPGRQLGYIANALSPTISVIDLDSLTLVDSIVFRDLAGKAQSHTLAVSLDGSQLWVGEDLGPDTGFVQVLDLATGRAIKRWDVGAGVGTHLTRDGKYFFSVSTKTNAINVFDAQNLEYLGDFPVGAAPHAINTSPDGRVLWTNDRDKGNLLSFDISGLPERLPTAIDTIPIGGTLHALLVHPNGKYVLVGSDQSGDNIVDTSTKEIVATVPGKPHNYEISPDGRYLLSGESVFADCEELKHLEHLLGDSRGPLLRFVNIATLNGAEAADFSTIKTEKWLDGSGLGPASISHQIYDPSGKYLLVTTYRHSDASPNGEGELLIVNGESLKVERVLTLPTRPHGLALPGIGR